MMNSYDLTLEQWQQHLTGINEKPFHARQIFRWLYQKDATSFDMMSDLSLALREKLAGNFDFFLPAIAQKQTAKDGTRKYLLEMADGSRAETVLMTMPYGHSVCVSSQVGCNMGCKFCASGLLKKQRNLTAGEMMGQVMVIARELKADRVSHVVVMGTGEPFDNYDEVNRFIHILNSPYGLAIGARHITVSTCGLIDGIKRYAENDLQTNLAISLHAADDETRSQIMPVNQAYGLSALRAAIQDYIAKTNRRVTLEYILLKDVNDSLADARKLAHYIGHLNVYVNLIPYNPVSGSGFKKSQNIKAFHEELLRLKVPVTLRKEHGSDIDAACGQLRARSRRR